jgi:hypothetical protein
MYCINPSATPLLLLETLFFFDQMTENEPLVSILCSLDRQHPEDREGNHTRVAEKLFFRCSSFPDCSNLTSFQEEDNDWFPGVKSKIWWNSFVSV